MTNTYLPIHLDVEKSITKNQSNLNDVSANNEVVNRRRSNSQSQVISTPTALSRSKEKPNKRNHVLYFVTLTPLNDTFIKKQLLVPYFPETRKLGRPAGSKVKPDITNGFFDSRVLSRSHAAMFIDASSGKVMLKDLGSSNGTYVNEERIGNDPVEIKIGDIIYLGFNIQADTNHKQISAKVENINVMQNFYTSSSTIPSSFNFKNQLTMDTPEFKHYNFIQDIISKLPNTKKAIKTNERHLSFENALFGDINPNLEDTLLGLSTNGNCGIFNNAQITNASSLDSAIRVLTTNLSKIRHQNNTLATLEEFIIDYQARLNELNSNFLKQEFESKLKKLEDQISEEKNQTQETKDKHKSYIAEATQIADQLRKEVSILTNEKHALNQKINEIDKLHEKGLNANKKELIRANEVVNIENFTSKDFNIDNTNSNGKHVTEIIKSRSNDDDKKQEVTSSNDKNIQDCKNYALSDINDIDCSVMDYSDEKKIENQPTSTPPISDNELETSRNIPNATDNEADIEPGSSINSLDKGINHKKGSYSAMLQLLPLKDKITIALYFTLLLLVIQSIERNRGMVFGLSIILFINVFQRLSTQN
ncbi:unnamed protein product [Debaryomyces tyrocola]|nr:unnamed protein product [Debaryomyces tyrocola]